MIKMYIGGEEVVCNKEFTIKEEMLSTSSTILNNCYPKTWEQDHDYISRFYYPKDYSKCLIQEEINTPAEEGEYATGTNLSINVDNTKEWSYQLEGDTQQTTTTGKNLSEIVDGNISIGGLDITIENGIITLNGTTTSNLVAKFSNNLLGNTGSTIPADWLNEEVVSSTTSKTLSINVISGTAPTTGFAVRTYVNGSMDVNANSLQNNRTFTKTYSSDGIMNYVGMYTNTGKTFNNFKFTIQLENGTEVTSFEPYTGGIPSPNPNYPQNVNVVTGEQNIEIVGKNLFDKSTITSVTNGTNNEGLITSNNINVDTSYNVIPYFTTKRMLAGTYTYSFQARLQSGTSTINKFNDGIADGTNIIKPNLSSEFQTYSFTKTYSTDTNVVRLLIQFVNSTNAIIEIKNIQIEKGNSATSFQEYQTQNFTIDLGSTKLCEIGTSQDYIYENNGDWYLHKETEIEILPSSDTTNRVWTKSGVNKNNTFIYTFRDHYLKVGSAIYSNMFLEYTATYLTNNNIYGCAYNTTGDGFPSIRVGMTLNGPSTVANFRTWLSTNQPTFYYELATPTDTQITDTSLIQQLNNLKNATLFNGINNITVSGSLSSILNLHYNFVTPKTETNLLFAGMVKNSGNISLNPRYPKYCALEILDFKDFLSTGEYLDFVISNKTVLEAIQMVVDAVAQYGFVLGNVNILGGDEIIGAYSTQEKSAYDVFQYLADITGSRWTTRMIDENTVAIDFYDPTLMPRGQDIEYTQEWWETNQVNDLSFSYGSRDYRNKQIMLSNQVYGGTNYNETIIADGYSKNFNTTENIGVVQSIYINGTQVSVATNVDEELGIDADFYYTPGNNSFSSDDSQIYAAGTLIVITYTPLIKGREVIYNTDEVNRVNSQIGRKGVVARYEQRNDILYTEDLEKIGQSYIKYKGNAEVILTLKTQVDIYNVGEVVYFNAPIQDLAQDYMVKRKSTQIIVTGDFSNVWYTYELTSSFNSENAINWFDNQRNKVSGNISEGEYITRNIDIENTANIIWDNLTITEVTPVGDNILNAPLNSPFIQ